MLVLLNLLGAIFAGTLVEGVAAHSKEDAQGWGGHDDGDGDPAERAPDEGAGDLLDEVFRSDSSSPEDDAAMDGIVTDDLPILPDAPREVVGGPGDDLIDGGNSGDRLAGGAGNDQINARGGDDIITGGAGDDIVWAGDGDDHVDGGDDDDTLYGGTGDDWLAGGAGDDWLAGEGGDDSLSGGDGDDTLIGGEGDDRLDGGAGDDWLAGGWGDDTLIGGAGSDTLDGGSGNDWLSGLFPEGNDDSETDFLNGTEGDDTLWLGMGDIGTGGQGADSFVLPSWMAAGEGAIILDHDPAEDQIVVVVDHAAHPDPQLVVEQGEGDTTRILLDGATLATVNGRVELADIRLVEGGPGRMF
mgnify:CR=1 FL=1